MDLGWPFSLKAICGRACCRRVIGRKLEVVSTAIACRAEQVMGVVSARRLPAYGGVSQLTRVPYLARVLQEYPCKYIRVKRGFVFHALAVCEERVTEGALGALQFPWGRRARGWAPPPPAAAAAPSGFQRGGHLTASLPRSLTTLTPTEHPSVT